MKNKIKEIRKKRGLSQEDIGDQLGVEKSQISKLERGQTKLHSEWIRKLTSILDCTASELLGEEDIKGPNEGGAVVDIMSKEAIIEILRQIRELYPDVSAKTQELLVGKVYDELKNEPGIDPGYVRGFLRSKNLEKLL